MMFFDFSVFLWFVVFMCVVFFLFLRVADNIFISIYKYLWENISIFGFLDELIYFPFLTSIF